MIPEQKQAARNLIDDFKGAGNEWDEAAVASHMAALLQELANAPEPKPVAVVSNFFTGRTLIIANKGIELPDGAPLYDAPPSPSVPVWNSVNSLPVAYEPVMCRLEDGQERIGRWSEGGYWQFAEFLHRGKNQRNKCPPIEQKHNKVVAWRDIYTAPTSSEAPADVARDAERYRHICMQDFSDRQWVETYEEFKLQRDEIIDAAIERKAKKMKGQS